MDVKELNKFYGVKINSIAIVEDDKKISEYLAHEIGQAMNIDRLLVFNKGDEALYQLSATPVNVALFDIELPGMNGIECIKKLKMIHPKMEMIVLTAYDNSENVFEAIRAGASGYLLKSISPAKIIDAIYDVFGGGSVMSSQIARKVMETFALKHNTNECFQDLSRREQEILEQLSKGFRYKEIADRLFISIETVRTHVRNIYEKLHVNSRVEALKKTGFL